MAPADNLSPPGSSSYSSNTMTVGDGTWDFTKNSFLLPNLVGLNFDTMRYNGMGNRFSTLTQYHTLITGHGVLAAITFLFIVPTAVLYARFYTRNPGYALRYHAYLNILAVLLSTVVFILGFMAVGPSRNLTNPHHGIGVAIYVLILLQAIGGRLVRHITGRSLRVHIHRYSGRCIALLGIVQVPLGLTLYGSPRYLFILYALWMAFLALLFFILDYRDGGRRGDIFVSGGRSDGGHDHKEKKKGMGWLGPLAAGGAIWALMRRRNKKKDRDAERDGSRSPSLHRSHSRRRSVGPEVIPSPTHETSTFYDEKHSERRRESGGGGFMKKALAAGAVGALVGRMMGGRKDKNRNDGSDYSAVATDTPSRHRPSRRYAPTESDFTERTEDTPRRHHDRRGSLLPPPAGYPVAAAAAISAADRPTNRPTTPQRSHAHSRFDSADGSDYSSYVSPSKRPTEKRKSSGSGIAKGVLAGLTFGWLGKKAKDSRDRREEERLRDEEDRRREEEDRRAGRRNSRYTGDGYGTPTRRESSRRRPHRNYPPPSAITNTASELSSIEPRGDTPYDPAPVGATIRPTGPVPVPVPGAPPPMALPPAGGAPMVPLPVPIPGAAPVMAGRSRSHSRDPMTPGGHAAMPPMPSDPQGFFARDSDSDTYNSPSGGRRRPSHRTAAGGDVAAAAAAAAASASILAQEQREEEDRRRREQASSSGQPAASVRVKVHDDRDRNITLRRLTEEETAAERRREQRQRRRADSVSSHSEADTPVRRYRRGDSSQRRAEDEAQRRVELSDPPPLVPPNPGFAQGSGSRRPKDSAYYSGAGPSAAGPSGAMHAAGQTVSSLGGSPGPGPGWSGISGTPGSAAGENAAADRRRRRRLERREGSRSGIPGSVDFD
ncbi:cytochrome b561/ferric reductase transmembrane [Apodospora peruviana]|uniref:Cytochrome b561/ferric reductase transmembrane n=1 Tax=Apodospora peruviana TaxID=516989 RepID=A0AAE0HVU4_9PEZI|nr:cytochrome b561/ferric reductase transmembrane [Apodospora peruviana]